MQANGLRLEAEPQEQPKSGLRHVTIFFSDIVGFSELTQRRGDVAASRVANRLLTLQEIIITRDGLGKVLQFGGDSVFAVFDQASVALNRALEIQRVLEAAAAGHAHRDPLLRIGLHMGEVLVQEGERLELISRHVNRAHRVMEAAALGQILASEVVVDAARDFIDLPRQHLALRHYGEFYLKGVGTTALCEVADTRLRKPHPPLPASSGKSETALVSRLELAGYRSVTRLGEGAFGVVYRALPESSDQPVALKILHPMLCEDPPARERFAREVDRTAQLNLSGCAKVLEQRLDHQPPFFVMELVEGRPLDVALAGAPPDRIAQVFRRLCATLEQAHAKGIIHCDLKPGNVLVQADDSTVIMDFGIATLAEAAPPAKTSSTSLLGTPAYVAPEVIQGKKPGPSADVYALGVLLYRVLAGREPFNGETVHQVIQAHLHEDPLPPSAFRPDLADGLQRICLKALEKDPAERYLTAGILAEDLERFLRGELIRTRPTAYDNLLFHRVRRHVEQIKDWSARGLLGPEESNQLLSAYEGLQRRGLPAVMEGRMFRLWQTLVYIGGWAVINGSLLWLMQHYEELPRTARLLLGSVPALTTFTLAALMWRVERFRLFFVALIVAVLATPLLTGVWLHEFKIGAIVPLDRLSLELLHDSAASHWITNQQILLTALVTLIVAGGIMLFTRTTTHSAQTVAASMAFYFACLLPQGLRACVDNEQWARLALQCVPLLLGSGFVAAWLLRQPERIYQAPPWIYSSTLLLLTILYACSLHGLQEWWPSLPPEKSKPLSFLALSLAGAILTAAGLSGRAWLRHRCRLATLLLVLTGLVSLLAGLGLAGWKGTWPVDWSTLVILRKEIPFPHLALPLAALGITLAACRFQMFAFLLVGLAGLAFSIHVLGHLYFADLAIWPKCLMSLGAACFFGALYRELRRTRGDPLDDVVSQARL